MISYRAMKKITLPAFVLAALLCVAVTSVLDACADNMNAAPPASASNATSTPMPAADGKDGGGGW